MAEGKYFTRSWLKEIILQVVGWKKIFARSWLKELILQEVNWKKSFYKKLAQRNYFGSSGLEENILHEGGLKK